jgi:AraC family transcriptional regulator, regulatory protein of adaptative response / methylated-DNA-[protein]-cysteine methyltransferase
MGGKRKPSAAVTQAAAAITADPRWASVRARDATADGAFYYAVKTTGVYCRPSCAARPARPENIAFYADRPAAERAGYRACRRCKPEQPSAALRRAAVVAQMCRAIDEADDAVPTLDELAGLVDLSSFHAHRLFKEVTGLTPKAYAAARRGQRVRRALPARPTVTDAIYDAGFNSSARFYEKSTELLGMTPTQYKAGARELPIRFAIAQCSLGAILVAATSRGVCAILFGDDPEELAHDLERRFPRAELIGADAAFEELVARVISLVEAPAGAAVDLSLDIRGTAFQERVWKALSKIPAGATATYAQIAAAIGAPSATRAVAQACGANSLAVAIPCHRVVRTDGSLSGYRWGVERKQMLLEREAQSAPKSGSPAGKTREARP